MQSGQEQVIQTARRYVGKSVINKLTLINSVLKERYNQGQSIGHHVAVLKSQSVQLSGVATEFDD